VGRGKGGLRLGRGLEEGGDGCGDVGKGDRGGRGVEVTGRGGAGEWRQGEVGGEWGVYMRGRVGGYAGGRDECREKGG